MIKNKRPTCKCGNPAAINYKKNNRTYYRKKCYKCIIADKKPTKKDWELAGYVKKDYCEKCGFRAIHSEQINVIRTKGAIQTYKSVCLNCNMDISLSSHWSAGDLTPDF